MVNRSRQPEHLRCPKCNSNDIVGDSNPDSYADIEDEYFYCESCETESSQAEMVEYNLTEEQKRNHYLGYA